MSKEINTNIGSYKKAIYSGTFDPITNGHLDIIKRARNAKVNSHPKHTDILTYKHATALEALIGYLYMQNNYDRIAEILKYILEI